MEATNNYKTHFFEWPYRKKVSTMLAFLRVTREMVDGEEKTS